MSLVRIYTKHIDGEGFDATDCQDLFLAIGRLDTGAPVACNRWTVVRLGHDDSGQHAVPGRWAYDSLAQAVRGARDDVYDLPLQMSNCGRPLECLAVRESCTDLTNPVEAQSFLDPQTVELAELRVRAETADAKLAELVRVNNQALHRARESEHIAMELKSDVKELERRIAQHELVSEIIEISSAPSGKGESDGN